MTAHPDHTIDIACRYGYGRCGVVLVWKSAVQQGRRVVLFPLCIMSYSLTVREKEHWKDRISARIDKRIDAICAANREYMERVRTDARDRAVESLGATVLIKRYERQKRQIAALEEKQDQTQLELAAQVCGVSIGKAKSMYRLEQEIADAIDERRHLHEDELLVESKTGREIVSLKKEKEDLLDTVWLATSGKQIKDLWQKVERLLGGEQTTLQQEAMKIAPVEDN